MLVRNEDVDADALLASCAVPFLLPAKRLGGSQSRPRLSFDGGLRDACPLWAARAMGSQEIVGVNVWTRRENRRQPGVTMIEPPQPLGAMHSSAIAATEQVAAWIEAGRLTANAVFAR